MEGKATNVRMAIYFWATLKLIPLALFYFLPHPLFFLRSKVDPLNV